MTRSTNCEHVFWVMVLEFSPINDVVELEWRVGLADCTLMTALDQKFAPDRNRWIPTGIFSFKRCQQGVYVFFLNVIVQALLCRG